MERNQSASKKIVVRIISSSEPRKQTAFSEYHPYAQLDPKAHRRKMVEVLGRVWADICRREGEENNS